MTKLKRRTFLASASLMGLSPMSMAQASYPIKPIRYIIPVPAGSGADMIGRATCERLSKLLGQPIVIDNISGGGGAIACQTAARAQPDGYTLILAAASHSINGSLYSKLNYDPLKDFTGIGFLSRSPFIMEVASTDPSQNLKEFIALAKSQPGKLSMAHGGNGTAMHLSTALLNQMSDMKLVEIPYKGSGPAALDVLTGQVPLAIVDLPDPDGPMIDMNSPAATCTDTPCSARKAPASPT